MAWYEKNIEDTLRELDTSAAAGISGPEASKRRVEYGPNETGKSQTRQLSVGSIGILVMPAALLAVTAVICLLLGRYTAAAVTFAAALLTAALRAGSLGEIRRVLGSVAAVTAPMTTVIRDGVPEIIESSRLVPGDLVQLRAGDIVGADMRLVETIDLVADESILPGGFMAARKDASAVLPEDAEPAQQINMCHTGTVIRSGSGRAVVVATGSRIASPFAVRPPYEYEHRSLLNRTIARQNRRAAIVGGVCCAVILVCGLLLQTASAENLVSSILNALVSFAVLIPAGLSLTEAVLSAAGIRRMALSGTMVKSLDTMSRLSSLNTILAQKTGAIAGDEMTVTHIWTGGHLIDVRGRGYAPDGRFLDADGKDVDPSRSRSLALTLIGGALCGDSDIEEVSGKWTFRGDPTEAALVTVAAKAGLPRADMLSMFPRIAEFPFEPERRRMTTVHRRGRQAVAYAKGAPAAILERCTSIHFGNEVYPITEQAREQLTEVVRRLTEQGLRVLAVAYREFPELPDPLEAEAVECDLIFAGFSGIDCRASRSAVAAYNLCAASGIRTVLVSGDSAATTSDLALSMGVSGDVLTGEELESLTPEELQERIRTVRICAETTPEQKRTLVTLLRRIGGVTAVTGIRASDAPSLMSADIGVAIGENASELTRDSADVVSEKTGYAGLVRAVEESRRKFLTLRAYCGYVYAAAAAVLFTALALLFATPPVPFSMLHLVWIGVVLALIPALVIGNEPGERDVMRRPPLDPAASAYGPLTVVSSLIQGLVPAILAVAAYFIAQGRGVSAGLGSDAAQACARTAVFVTLTLSLLTLAHSARSAQTGLQRMGFFTNRALTAISLGTVAVLLLAVFLPALHGIFDTVSIGIAEWLFALLAALLTLVWSELYKSLLRPLLARSLSDDAMPEQELPKDAKLIDRLFARFSRGDPTQEEELSRRQRRKQAAREAEASAEAAEDAGTAEETPALEEPQEESEEPAAEEAEPAPEEEDDVLSHVLASLPDELLPYADIIAQLPPELLDAGLDGIRTALTGEPEIEETAEDAAEPETEEPAETEADEPETAESEPEETEDSEEPEVYEASEESGPTEPEEPETAEPEPEEPETEEAEPEGEASIPETEETEITEADEPDIMESEPEPEAFPEPEAEEPEAFEPEAGESDVTEIEEPEPAESEEAESEIAEPETGEAKEMEPDEPETAESESEEPEDDEPEALASDEPAAEETEPEIDETESDEPETGEAEPSEPEAEDSEVTEAEEPAPEPIEAPDPDAALRRIDAMIAEILGHIPQPLDLSDLHETVRGVPAADPEPDEYEPKK